MSAFWHAFGTTPLTCGRFASGRGPRAKVLVDSAVSLKLTKTWRLGEFLALKAWFIAVGSAAKEDEPFVTQD